MVAVVFLLFNYIITYAAEKEYKSKINPVSVFTVLVSISLFLHEMKLIEYDDITAKAFFILLIGESIYVAGCFLGKKRRILFSKNNNPIVYESSESNEACDSLLAKAIIVLSAISAIAILSGFILLLIDYDYSIIRILRSGDAIYAAHVTGKKKYLFIPYLSSFATNSLVLSGILLKRSGFKKRMIIPIFLEIMISLMTGSRYVIVLGALIFISSVLITQSRRGGTPSLQKKRQTGKHSKLSIVFFLFVLFLVFRSITKARSNWITINEYVNPFMANIMSKFGGGIYKVYTYFASPVGVLSAFLENPYYSYGRDSFSFVFNFMKRFGIVIVGQMEGFDTNYYIPIASNTGTFLKNMIADFGLLSPFVVFAWGIIVSQSYQNAKEEQTVCNLSICSILMAIASFCFFSWYLTDGGMWISIIVAIATGKYIDKKVYKCSKQRKC